MSGHNTYEVCRAYFPVLYAKREILQMRLRGDTVEENIGELLICACHAYLTERIIERYSHEEGACDVLPDDIDICQILPTTRDEMKIVLHTFTPEDVLEELVNILSERVTITGHFCSPNEGRSHLLSCTVDDITIAVDDIARMTEKIMNMAMRAAIQRRISEIKTYMNSDAYRRFVNDDEYIDDTPVTDIRESLMSCLERYVDPQYVLEFREYIQGETQADIAARYDTTQANVSRHIKHIRERTLGYAFEDVYARMLRSGGYNVRQGGANTDEPDIEILDERGDVVEVHSVKCYLDKKSTITIPAREIGQKEWELFKQGIPLFLVVFDVVANKLHKIRVRGDEKNFTIRK